MNLWQKASRFPTCASLARKRQLWEKLLYTARLIWSQRAEERVHPSGFSLPKSRHVSRDADLLIFCCLAITNFQASAVRWSFVRHRPDCPRLMSSIFVIVSSPRKRGSRLTVSSTRPLGIRRDRPQMPALPLVWTCPSQSASQAVQA